MVPAVLTCVGLLLACPKEIVGEWSANYGNRRCAGVSELEIERGMSADGRIVAYDDFDAWERTLRLENRSSAESAIFSEIRELDVEFPVPVRSPCWLVVQDGMVPGENYARDDTVSAREFACRRIRLAKDASLAFETSDGRSSQGVMPFFDLTDGAGGWVIAIGWSGDWRAEFSRTASGVRVRTGLRRCRFKLLAGERVRTASVLVMRYEAEEDASNKFRRLVKRHIAARVTRTGRSGVTATELWGGLPSATMLRRISEYRRRGLDFSELWIDAGWAGGGEPSPDVFSNEWWTHVGDWFPNPKTHPKSLADVRDAANTAGMRLMIWFEPERAGRDSNLRREHPEWLLWKSGEKEGDAVVDLGNSNAWTYVCGAVDAVVTSLGMSCYRQDFNVAPGPYFAFNEEPDRIGIREIGHVTGLYRLWDVLLERHPDLLIDDCAGGGRRIDLELLRRSVLFCRSDYQCHTNILAEVVQAHHAGSSRYLPYTGCWSKLRDLYSLRSSYAPSWGTGMWGAGSSAMDEADFETLNKALKDYRRIERYLTCDFYCLGSVTADPAAWAAWHYRDETADAGVVMAFRRPDSPSGVATFRLPQLGEGTYEFENLDTDLKISASGDVLRCNGLEVALPKPRSSAIFVYRRCQSEPCRGTSCVRK